MTTFSLGVVDDAKPWDAAVATDISLTAQPSTTNNQSSYTFSNVAIGTATTNRIVVARVFASGVTGEFSSVTIGGVTATKAASVASGTDTTAIYYAKVSSGTTANIVITCSNTANRCNAVVYRVVSGYGALTPTYSSGEYASTITSYEITDGAVVWAAMTPASTTAYTVSRDGSALSTDASSAYGGNTLVKTGSFSVTGSTNFYNKATYTTAANNAAILAVSWR